ncbi:MAG: phosphotransferase [Polyangiaceae bacterium]|nr:phosphotransferase [Polyangiaceae bacterium]
MSSSANLEVLRSLVRRLTGSDPAAAVRMPGGASTREFYRVGLEPSGSAVAMFVPDADRPEEVTQPTGSPGRPWPLLEVRALLEQRGVRVPRLLGEACQDGWVLVEDLGDDTLANHLESFPESRDDMVRLAVVDLARAQRALADLPATSIVGQRRFDRDLLRWEIDHFREWGLEARGVTLGSAERRLFDAASEYLVEMISRWSYGFVHRDYQSRNLMVRSSNGAPELVWIDFQDALLGPRVYDLVALLSDSYQSFERSFIDARLDEYMQSMGGSAADRERLGREFDLVTVQRKLKDAGRFVFIDRKKHNPSFLKFVEPTVDKVRAALARLGDDRTLVELGGLLESVLRRVPRAEP